MGLLDSLKSTFTSTGEASVPPAASFATREGVIYAPVNGVLVNLNEVPDETIASGMLGQGYGIEPITGTIYAPANGRIGATTVTNHSIGMITEDGLRVFIGDQGGNAAPVHLRLRERIPVWRRAARPCAEGGAVMVVIAHALGGRFALKLRKRHDDAQHGASHR